MTPVFPREGAAVPFFFVCAGMRRTGGTGVSAHGAETRDAPPIFFLRHQKENAPCTVEKKSASSKLARAGKFGDANGRKPPPDKTCQVSSRCTITRQSSSLQAASCSVVSHPGCLSTRPASLSAAAPGDGFQRKGPQPLPSGRLGKGSRGKPSRKGFPLASLWGRPVSLGERNGSHTLRSGSLR